jgi:hypothetical protein
MVVSAGSDEGVCGLVWLRLCQLLQLHPAGGVCGVLVSV